MISAESLMRAGIARPQAEQFAEPLRAACALFAIDTPQRIAGLIAQASHESARLSKLEESLYYTDAEWMAKVFLSRFDADGDSRLSPAEIAHARTLVRKPEALANFVYAGRYGNGGVASGHGWLYRGRGPFGLTFLDNYRAAERDLGRPYVSQPDLVATPSDGALAAAWFWHTRGCNALADAGRIDEITRKINPAMLHAADRRALYERALPAFA